MDLKGGPDADTLTPQAAGSGSQRGSKAKMVSLERRKVLNTQDVIFVVQLEFTRWSTVTGWAARSPLSLYYGPWLSVGRGAVSSEPRVGTEGESGHRTAAHPFRLRPQQQPQLESD